MWYNAATRSNNQGPVKHFNNSSLEGTSFFPEEDQEIQTTGLFRIWKNFFVLPPLTGISLVESPELWITFWLHLYEEILLKNKLIFPAK